MTKTNENSDQPISPMLAFDLGLTTGVALHRGDGIISTSTFSLHEYIGGYDDISECFIAFLNGVDRWVGTPIKSIWIQDIRTEKGSALMPLDATVIYVSLLSALVAWNKTHNVACRMVPKSTIRPYDLGKDSIMDFASARGFKPANESEGDALAILLWAMETLGMIAPSTIAAKVVAEPATNSNGQ